MKKQILLFTSFFLLLLPIAHANETIAKGEVSTSIPPVYSLVAPIMKGAGEPSLVLNNNSSSHGVSLKPSQRRTIQQAKLLFFIDQQFERFLEPVLRQTSHLQAEPLIETTGLILLPLRPSHTHSHAEHENGHTTHNTIQNNEPLDYHIWLSPENAIVMIKHITTLLSKTYPQHSTIFERNSLSFIAAITAKKTAWKAQLRPIQHKPFVVFHDAYQYLENHFDLHQAGIVIASPERPNSIKHLRHLNETIIHERISCVFIEPQFSQTQVKQLINIHQLKVGLLDPLGTSLPIDSSLYLNLMQHQVDALVDCLQ